MKRNLTILTCFIALCSFAFGQQNHWTPNTTSELGFTMSVIATVSINGTEQTSNDLEVGVFDGEIVRGSARLEWYNILNRSIVRLTIYGNTGDNMTLKLYDHGTETELNYVSNNIITFEGNGTLGSIKEPYQINFNTPAVAQIVGGESYTTLAAAVSAAEDGATIELLSNINEAVNIISLGKTITIDGKSYDMTAGLSFGSDNNNLDNGIVTIKNIDFVGTGVSVKELKKVTIQNNTFTNITANNGITVICDNLTEEVNVSENIVSNVDNGAGIRIRNPKALNITNNNVEETSHNAITIEGTTYGDAVITGNVLKNWGKGADNGRAIRMVKGANTTATITNNAMLHNNAPEEFVKITNNTENVNINENYWNGNNPVTKHTPAYYLAESVEITSYYKEFNAETNELSNLIDFTKLPNAEVICLGAVTVTEYNVYNGSLIEGTEALNVPVVMEFIANDTPEEAQANPFGEYTTDFYITFDGINEGSFVADGCYLIGHYGDFGWIQIPVDGLEIENGVTYPVITSNGLDFSYIDICTSVKDFKCGIYIAPEILAANPDMTVQLELGLSEDIEAAQAAQFITVDEPYVYDVDVLSGKVAKVGETTYTTLAEAVAAANNEETVELLISAQGSGVVIDKDITIDFGGFTYTFTSPAVGSTGTPTQGFQILKDNTVTLQNGTLNVAEDARTDFAMLIQNYADLTITDMTLDGDNLDRYTIKDYDYSYVLSNNSGEVSIKGETNIIANPGDPTFEKKHRGIALDACKYSSYAAPIVTVNTTGEIKGIVEVSATLNLNAIGEGSNINVELTGNGQLYNKVAVKGSMTKSVTGSNEGWGTISSPVGTVEISDVKGLLTANNSHDFYRYNEAKMLWENIEDNTNTDFTELEEGRGYLYANTEDTDVVFEGTFAAETVSVNLGYTEGTLAGFNLVGNPYTHNITEEHFAVTEAELASGFYAITKNGGLVSQTKGTIAPMESVMVKTNAPTTLNIKKELAASKRSESENNGQIKIEVSNDNYNDVAYVSFNEGIGLDKINHRNAEIPMVYVPVDGINYAVATMSQDVTEIPVSFRAMTMGQYTIGAEAQDCEYAMMTLVDRLTGTETNLLLEDYTFVATTKDNADRFIIKLAKINADGENEDNFAFINNGMMYIYNIEGQGMVSIYDVTGRPVAEFNVETSANIPTSELTTGIYIIRMTDNNGVKVQKILID